MDTLQVNVYKYTATYKCTILSHQTGCLECGYNCLYETIKCAIAVDIVLSCTFWHLDPDATNFYRLRGSGSMFCSFHTYSDNTYQGNVLTLHTCSNQGQSTKFPTGPHMSITAITLENILVELETSIQFYFTNTINTLCLLLII